jgi:flagellar basal body-associated protein FliL
MDTKDIVIIVLVIAIILAVGGIFVLNSNSNDNSDDNVTNITNNTTEDSPQEVTKNATVEENNNDGDDVTAGLSIVKEEVYFNGQAGEGYIREVTYSDGNFRQYDSVTEELIGSSFEGDQARLGNPDGNLE